MKNKIFTLLAGIMLFATMAIGQTIVKGSGVLYTNGVPTLVATQSADAEIAIDTTTGFWYEYNRDALAWSAAGFRIQLRNPCTTPTHTPGDKQSYVLLDTCDNLYRYLNGTWTQINSGGGGGATDLGYSGTSSPITITSSTGADVTVTQGGIVTVTASGSNMTISATETDGSVTNEGQLGVGAGGANTATITTNTSGGNPVTVSGGGILAVTETTGSNGGTITLTATEVDGSITNEGILGVGAGGASSSTIISNTSGASGVTINVAGINSITETTNANGGSITITATEVDGSTTNELQTIANTSDATSHTATLSNSGGSLKLVEGSNITLTTTGTSGDGVVTIAATGSSVVANNGVSDNEDSGKIRLGNRYMNSPDAPFTMDRKLNLDANKFYIGDNTDSTLLQIDGTNDRVGIGTTTPGRKLTVNGEVEIKDLTTTAATIIVGADGNGVLSEISVGSGLDLTAGVLTATGGGGGGSTDLSYTGTNSPITLNSSTGTDVTITEGGIIDITATGTNMTITAAEVDGSVTNEGQLGVGAGAANTATITTNTSGGNPVTVEAAGILAVTETTGANGGTIVLTATEVDGSVSNEGTLGVGAGGASSSTITTTTSGGNPVTINVAGINAITESTSANGGSITITATEVDGSVTNELQTISNTSNATSHTVTLSNTGGSVQLVEGSNITLTTTGTASDGIVTIAAAAEVDGSISNEGILGVGAGGANTATITTNTSTGNAVTVSGGGILAVTETTSANGGTITLTATEVDGSVTNELQTIANTSNATSHTATLSNSGGSIQLVEGTGITMATTGTGLDGIVTITNSSPDQTVTLTQGGIVSITGTYPSFTISATETDGSISNEGILGVGAGGANTATITTNTSTGNAVTVSGGGILAVTETTSANGGTITLTATEADGSTTNELQTITNTSNATSHTVTLSNTGGSVQLVEGSNITLTTSGTGADGIVTIASTGGTGDINQNGNSFAAAYVIGTNDNNTVSLEQNGTTAVTIGTDKNITATASVAATNSATDRFIVQTNSTGTPAAGFGSGIFFRGESSTTDNRDMSAIRSIWADATDATRASDLAFFNVNSGILAEKFRITAGGHIQIQAVTGTATSVIGRSASGLVSQVSLGAGLTLTGGTLAAEDVSSGNELQTLSNTSNATSHTVTLSNTGGSVQLVEGSNITLTTTGTGADGIVTIASTGSADGNGYYSGNGGNGGNGTIPSLTTSTITNQFTLSRATDDVGGLVPVRISVPLGNEPDFMSFVNGSDSLLISKGDQEFEIFANKTLALSSNELVTIVADSTQVQTIPNAVENERTLLLVSPANTIVKSEGLDPDIINQNGATVGQVLEWNGTKWAPAADDTGGGGGNVGTDVIWDAKGDLAVGTGANTAIRLAVGNDNMPLVADQTTATGVRWGNFVNSATQLTADQNNYQPTDFNRSRIVNVSSDSEIRYITGFAGTFDGDQKTIINTGTNTIVIPTNHTGSSSAQRVRGEGVYYLHPGNAFDMVYQNSLSGWYILDNSPRINIDKMSHYAAWQTGSTTLADKDYWTNTLTGTGAGIAATTANFAIPGGMSLITGTTATGQSVFHQKTVIETATIGDHEMIFDAVVSIPILSDATERFSCGINIDNAPNTMGVNNNSLFIRYTDNVNGGRWQGVSRSTAGVESTLDLGVTVAAATLYRLTILMNKQLTAATFYVDGQFKGTIATNLPANSTTVGPRINMVKSAGLTSRSFTVHRAQWGVIER